MGAWEFRALGILSAILLLGGKSDFSSVIISFCDGN
jgi:hypothetical protein